MKILHIASFSGNVGDIINHQGFYDVAELNKENIDQLEIRKFYNNSNELKFDEEILEKINKYDYLILGGGGFFDVYWDNSESGTTLNMTENFINGIKIPVIVNAMGVHIDYKAHTAIMKFKKFFSLITKKKWFITLRNDGSMHRLKRILEQIPSTVVSVPDNGFAFDELHYSGVKSNYVGMSITNDLFTQEFNGLISVEQFNEEISEVCSLLLLQGKKIIFFLHAPQDINVLSEIQRRLGLKAFRNQIIIAPYDTFSVENATVLNKMYSMCKFIIAMRFHSNVIAIKNKIPVIGLAGHEQIKGLYDELVLSNQCVIANEGFKNNLIEVIKKMDYNPAHFSKLECEVMKNIRNQQIKYKIKIKTYMEKN